MIGVFWGMVFIMGIILGNDLVYVLVSFEIFSIDRLILVSLVMSWGFLVG